MSTQEILAALKAFSLSDDFKALLKRDRDEILFFIKRLAAVAGKK